MKPKVKLFIIISLAALMCFSVLQVMAQENVQSGLEIMTRIDERDDGDDQTSTATFQLINKRGQTRKRNTVRTWKDYDGKDGFDTKMITFFESPPDVKGTGFLSWSYLEEDKDDNQWLYLPALRKTKRISASNKGDSFMGTDFTYDDMGDRKVNEDTHKLLKTEALNNAPCYVVESIPKEDRYIYSKKITWVDQANWLPFKVEYYDRKDRLLKTLTTEWHQVDKIWTWQKAVIDCSRNHEGGPAMR